MRERIERLARSSANFGFLLEHEPLLVMYGAGAESVVFTDPNGALVKCRQFVEVMAGLLIKRVGLRRSGGKLRERINALAEAGVLKADGVKAFHDVRRQGNDAVHEHLTDRRAALDCLRTCFELGNLLHRALTGDRKVRAFVPPQPAHEAGELRAGDLQVGDLRADLDRYRQELEDALLQVRERQSLEEAAAEARAKADLALEQARREREELAAQVYALEDRLERTREEFDTTVAEVPRVPVAERRAIVERARRPRPLNEAQARREIDDRLAKAGWIVQDMAELNPMAGRGVAVREFPLSRTSGRGAADYALYVDGRLVGVIEAKREGMTLTGVEWQSASYADRLPKQYAMAAWRREDPLPFRYESTGLETRFTNNLDPEPRSREVFTFHRPETVAAWMAEAGARPDAPTFRARVRAMPPLDEEGMRPAQVKAVNGVEVSLAADRPRALVQMATGAGKTWAAVTLSCRLLRYAGAKRILFLVDRNNLGDQAAGEFRNYPTPGDGRKLDELYNVQRLSRGVVLGSTHVVVTTIQRLDMALRGLRLPADDDPDVDDAVPERPVEARYNEALPPETFDLIVVDECHRSIYGKWRAVLDYFDAPIVGLTATPTAQTLGFFDQNLVAEYPYEQAVADGVNVDFDVYRIKTRISEDGSTIPALDEDGTRIVVPKRDRRTRRQRYEELEEDFTYGGEQIGRTVEAEDQIRTVVRAFKERVLPELFGERTTVPKTLIFAKSDEHADAIVRIVREVFGRGNDFAAKITYKSKADGNDPKQLLRLFQNSTDLRIAVTVDMIATGTDVKPLEVVFFLRGVRSAVYFEQMKGRGSRTVDAAEFQRVNADPAALAKERFILVDAVGVTDNPLCDARPLERDPHKRISLEQLLQKAAALSLTEDETATLGSRLTRLHNQISEEEREELARVGKGTSLRDIAKQLVDAVDPDGLIGAYDTGGEQAVAERLHHAATPLAENPELRQRILDIRRQHDTVIDEVSRDEVTEAYGVPREERAKGTITSFRRFLEENQDLVLLQQLRHGSGPRVPYADLKDLVDRVKRLPNVYSVNFLRRAYEDVGAALPLEEGEAGMTELVSILRYELGLDDQVRPYRSLVEERFAAWIAAQEQAGTAFSAEQRWHLNRIVDVIATQGSIAVDDLHGVPFTARGGAGGFAAAFGPRAESLLDELNQELPA